MNPTLIGVHGPLNGGKDTVANFIVAMDKTISGPPRWKRYAFARPIKDACKVLFGFTETQVEPTNAEERAVREIDDPFWGFSPRKTLQLLGTEFGRDMLRKDVWIKRAELEAKHNLKDGFKTIITDVRFENEAEWLRAQPNSLLIYIEVPGLEKDEKYQHASEAGIKRMTEDFFIINDKSKGLKSLYDQIEKIWTK